MKGIGKILLVMIVGLAAGYYVGIKANMQSSGTGEVKQIVSTNPLAKSGSGTGSLAQVAVNAGTRHTVRPGMLIQSAVIAANPGDVIEVYPGTYHETVYIDKDDITLTGVVVKGDYPLIDGRGELNDAILYSGNNIIIENLHIRRFKGNGIMGQAGNNFVIRNNIIDDAGVYGIFPQLGVNGLISGNVVSQIADAAIYVGMSDNIDVIHNEVFDSVAGIEIENTRHALVEGNYVYNNTGGILAFITPGLPIKTTYDVIIRRNFITNNNHVNFAAPGSTVAGVVQGTGILIMAADDVIVEDNIISGNQSVGILVVDHVTGQAKLDPGSDPNPDRVFILDNVMQNNGYDMQGGIKAFAASQFITSGLDILDAGPGDDKCILNGTRYHTIGIGAYSTCDYAAVSTLGIQTMTLETPAPAYVVEGDTAQDLANRVGKKAYYAICTGCHVYDGVLIGPSVKEIQTTYKGEAALLADYIANPHKVRPDFPEMPPQNYLSAETRMAVASFILKVDNEGNVSE